MNKNTIGWLSSIATALIMAIGMFIAWNPIYPIKSLGFFITCIGFLLAVLLSLGIIKYAKESKGEENHPNKWALDYSTMRRMK